MVFYVQCYYATIVFTWAYIIVYIQTVSRNDIKIILLLVCLDSSCHMLQTSRAASPRNTRLSESSERSPLH